MKGTRKKLIDEKLDRLLESHPDPDRLRVRFERLRRATTRAERVVLDGPEVEAGTLTALLSLGDVPVDEIVRHPHMLPMLLAPDLLNNPFDGIHPPEKDLARFKRFAWLKILLRDRMDSTMLERTLADLSELADRVAVEVFRSLGHGTPPVALWALGKWGSEELNASSDVDPVFFAEENLPPETADRIVREWVKVLTPEEGPPIYNVDLRLRPEGISGPLACSFGGAERYFFGRAAPWERIAWLRARHVCGPRPGWFEEMLEAFLFPSTEDPKRIVGEVARGLVAVREAARERDIKRGPGGIRDIEFLIASFQLSEGRQVHELRHGTILELVSLAREVGLLKLREAKRLAEGYAFHRRVENALQAEEDRPRFNVPRRGNDHAGLAFALGLSPDEFEKRFEDHRRKISRIVERRLFGGEPGGFAGTDFADPQAERREAMDGAEEETVNLESLAVYRRLSGRWGPASRLFDPEVAGAAVEPEEVLQRLESAVASYGGPGAWLATVGELPAMRRDATWVLARGKRLLDETNARPYLWERVGWREWHSELPEDGDPRKIAAYLGDLLFCHGARFIVGQSDALEVTGNWSGGVDRAISAVCGTGLTRSAPPVAIIALGKWGGQELAPDGDLDVVLVCGDGGASAVAKIQQRGANWLRDAELDGRLVLDPRLRPEGAGAPLVITLGRLKEYLGERAQPWERIAYARARFVAGDPDVGGEAELEMQRFAADGLESKQWEQVHRARRRAAEESRPRSGVLRIKKARGGMMDFEFATCFAAWKLGIGPEAWWHMPLADRMQRIAGETGDRLWQVAITSYRELRRWELAQLLGTGLRRGEVHTSGPEAERFARLVSMTVDQVRSSWRDIAAVGTRLYDTWGEM